MRKRELIEKDKEPYDQLSLEVLLDIRELLIPKVGKIIPDLGKKLGRPRGRPRGQKKVKGE